jgi:hypothetical protein
MMDIPPFTNSHSSYELQTVAVDRATLFPQSARTVVDDDKLKRLDELLKANLDVDVSHARKRRKRSASSEKGPSTLHETLEPARKSIYDCVNWCIRTCPSIQAYFYGKWSKSHLIGTKTPARESVSSSVAHLLFYLGKTSRLWEPPCEDNDREVEFGRQQALSAAVDVPSLLRSAQAYIVELSVCFSCVHDSTEDRVVLKKRKRLSGPVPCYLHRVLRSFWLRCHAASPCP